MKHRVVRFTWSSGKKIARCITNKGEVFYLRNPKEHQIFWTVLPRGIRVKDLPLELF